MDKLLPKELVTEIFSYLNFSDLCQLTLTCKSFNEIISNSSTLMDEFRLVYNIDSEIDIHMMMKRKIQRIDIETPNECLFKYLECYGENICEIKFDRHSLNSQEITEILNFCSNFKYLTFYNQTSFDYDWIALVSTLSFESITIAEYQQQFHKNATECKEESTELQLKSTNEDLINFLKNQKQLKTLRLYRFEQTTKLFKDDSLVNVDFQLKTLFSTLQLDEIVYRDNFKKFLKNQKSLCKFIDSGCCGNYAYADVLNDLNNVKELEILDPFIDIIPMQHIEILSICVGYHEMCLDFKKLFPSVKNLSILSSRNIKIAGNSNALGKREIIQISESVKTLTVKDVRFGNDGPFDDDVEIKIENLSIYRVDNIDWLIECFKNDRIKLKSLTIEETQIKKSQQEYLESLTRGENKKIEKLKIYIPMKMNINSNYVCDYLTEDEESDKGES